MWGGCTGVMHHLDAVIPQVCRARLQQSQAWGTLLE